MVTVGVAALAVLSAVLLRIPRTREALSFKGEAQEATDQGGNQALSRVSLQSA
jgi:hypothetical protein